LNSVGYLVLPMADDRNNTPKVHDFAAEETEPHAPIPFISYGIIALCIGVYLSVNLSMGDEALMRLVFSPGNGLVWPGILTHMFAHASLMHLLGNMLGVFFLGIAIEQRYGSLRYLVLYFLAGLVAAVSQAWTEPQGLLLGASGALAGVMAAFLRHYPHTRLYIYGVLPLPTWVFMPLWLMFNIWGASAGQKLSIAFVAHLAGFFAGLLLTFLIEPARRRSSGWPGEG
jgi:membrane associated rhomboid family serine protease